MQPVVLTLSSKLYFGSDQKGADWLTGPLSGLLSYQDLCQSNNSIFSEQYFILKFSVKVKCDENDLLFIQIPAHIDHNYIAGRLHHLGKFAQIIKGIDNGRLIFII